MVYCCCFLVLFFVVYIECGVGGGEGVVVVVMYYFGEKVELVFVCDVCGDVVYVGDFVVYIFG